MMAYYALDHLLHNQVNWEQGWGCGVTFQLWVRALLLDAVGHNKAHLVAQLAPFRLRQIYAQGVPPSIEEVAPHCESKGSTKSMEAIDERTNQGALAKAV